MGAWIGDVDCCFGVRSSARQGERVGNFRSERDGGRGNSLGGFHTTGSFLPENAQNEKSEF